MIAQMLSILKMGSSVIQSIASTFFLVELRSKKVAGFGLINDPMLISELQIYQFAMQPLSETTTTVGNLIQFIYSP